MIIEGKTRFNLIQKFLKSNWNKHFILANNKKVFNWQYYNKFEKKYNFLVYKKKKISGFLGIIKSSKFSKFLKQYDSIWLTTWVSYKKNLGIGLKLLDYAIKKFKYKLIGTIGCNDSVIKIYKYFGFSTGELSQYYIINNKITYFKILKNVPKKITYLYKKNKFSLNEVNKIKFKNFGSKLCILKNKLYKDEDFFNNKYLKNPFYKYFVYEFKKKNNLIAYYFTRECNYKNKKCLRIVDFFGNIKNIFDSSFLFLELIYKNNYEYVDFFISSKIKKVGLFKKNKYNKLIIPNYFEPFIQKNIKINYAFLSKNRSKNLYFFKGDCDQDRPNKII